MCRLAGTSLEASAEPRTPKLAAEERSAPARRGGDDHAAIKPLLAFFLWIKAPRLDFVRVQTRRTVSLSSDLVAFVVMLSS